MYLWTIVISKFFSALYCKALTTCYVIVLSINISWVMEFLKADFQNLQLGYTVYYAGSEYKFKIKEIKFLEISFFWFWLYIQILHNILCSPVYYYFFLGHPLVAYYSEKVSHFLAKDSISKVKWINWGVDVHSTPTHWRFTNLSIPDWIVNTQQSNGSNRDYYLYVT